MKIKSGYAAMIMLCFYTSSANAAGFDLGERVIDPLFEEGGYIEFSSYVVNVDVTGEVAGLPTGDVGDDFLTGNFSYKNDITDALSFALILDQPFARDLTYKEGPFAGAEAHLSSLSASGYLRYRFDNGFSIHGGLRAQRIDGMIAEPTTTVTFDDDWGFGYSAGIAYEIPSIALRASLTYDSEIETSHDTRFNTASLPGLESTSLKTPQSVNLKVQTGVHENVLVFGALRWTDWDEVTLDPGDAGGADLFNFRDGITGSLGAAYLFNEKLAGFVVAEIERKSSKPATSALDVDDNGRSLTVGVEYTTEDNLRLTGSFTYVDLYDREGEVAGAPVRFEDNHAIAFGLKVGYSF